MQKYLNKCHYDEDKEPYCPNFRLGYIAEKARENFSELCRTVSSKCFVLLTRRKGDAHLCLTFNNRFLMLFWGWHTDSLKMTHFAAIQCFLRSLLFLPKGGVIGVFINWKCNLDVDPSHCKPTYSFRRLDLRKDQANSGYYYRWASNAQHHF